MVDKDIKKNWVSSKVFGTLYSGQNEFNDREFAEGLEEVRIKEIVLYSNGYLCGIQVFYDRGQCISNGCYCDIDFDDLEDPESYITSTDGSVVTKKSYIFTEGEKISKIIIHSGDIIDGLGFETTNGNSFFNGGKGGSKTEIKLNDLTFGAISGSVAEVGVGNYWHTVHSLQFHFIGTGKLEIS